MKYFRYISVLLVGVTYLLLSSGIIVYKSACLCSGKENVSVFVSPETCTTEIHVHHVHNQEGKEESSSKNECHDCLDHSKDCGCDSPEINLYKLVEEFVPLKSQVHLEENDQLSEVIIYDSVQIKSKVENDKSEQFYIDPPPVVISSLDFLIQIQQLKIHCIS